MRSFNAQEDNREIITYILKVRASTVTIAIIICVKNYPPHN